MIYFFILAILFVCMMIYFRIADKYNIIDKPNERSSHKSLVLRGGGIIFPISVIVYTGFYRWGNLYEDLFAYFLLGILMISIISFLDDVQTVANKARILIHLVSVTALLFALNAFSILDLYVIVAAYILIIGTINAYNFMDGINGITGAYTLVGFVTLLYYNQYIATFADSNFIITGILACLVFLFFNFRKKAKCFAGDIGSISIAYWYIFLILGLIIYTHELKYIFFLSVYGTDTVLTIIHRIMLKQNIFQAHRLHFYQILANEKGIAHLKVATLYSLIQLGINIFIIHTDLGFVWVGIISCAPLAILYVMLKQKFMKAVS